MTISEEHSMSQISKQEALKLLQEGHLEEAYRACNDILPKHALVDLSSYHKISEL